MDEEGNVIQHTPVPEPVQAEGIVVISNVASSEETLTIEE